MLAKYPCPNFWVNSCKIGLEFSLEIVLSMEVCTLYSSHHFIDGMVLQQNGAPIDGI